MEPTSKTGCIRTSLHPSTSLVGQLSYHKKLSLLCLLPFIAMAVLLNVLHANFQQAVNVSQQELAGIIQIKNITRFVQLSQQHRGLAATVFSGYSQMSGRLATKERQLVEAFKTMEKELPFSLTSSEDFRGIKINLLNLLEDGNSLSVEDDFAVHTNLISLTQTFMLATADEYMLSIDRGVDTTHLIDTSLNKLPGILERLGQARAFGTSILVEKRITEKQKIKFHRIFAQIDDSLIPLKFSIQQISQHQPEVATPLKVSANAITDSVNHTIHAVESDIFTHRFALTPEDFWTLSTEAIDTAYNQTYSVLLPTIEILIKARITQAENTFYLSIGIALFLLLAMAYLSIGTYHTIVDSINSLTHAAQAYLQGNMLARVNIKAHDELSHVGNSFNKMADGFKEMLEARREDEARLHSMLDTSLDAVVQMNGEGIITGWRGQAEKIFGWSGEEIIGRLLHEAIIPQQYREAHARGLKHFLLSGEGPILNARIELIGLHRNGHEFPIELSIAAIKMRDKYEFNAFISDISKRNQAEEDINHLAFFDPLTQLPNRRLLRDRLQQAMAASMRSGKHGAVLFLDLDHFKNTNDTQGHAVGDLLLIEVALRLQSCVREGDSVARLGGDEFVVLLEELSLQSNEAATQAELIAEKIRDELNRPYMLKEYECYSTPSIGISLLCGQLKNSEDLIKHADVAMYQAKTAGCNTIRFFDPQMQVVLDKRAALEADLRKALAGQQFRLHYQIQVDCHGKATGAEALLRWEHPERGFVLPDQFISLAEGTGLILPIGLWVLQTACTQLKAWQDDALTRDLTLSVNVSAKQFRQAGFVAQVRQALLESGAKPALLKLELTESSVLEDVEDAIAKMHEIKLLGVSFSMDDFGTGYSSLQYLHRLPLDQVKIDKSFVGGISVEDVDSAIVRGIIAMANILKINIIAEGVETEEQRQLLHFYGCIHYQGYLFSKPIPVEQFAALLKEAGEQTPIPTYEI